MNAEMKNYVIKQLETYHDRERKIAVLRYDLEHPSEVGVTEQIEAMNYGSGEGVGHSKGHISNKTLYIALNYEEQAKQLNAESAKEIADELFILERRQKKLLYYISLLEKRQAEVVRMVYMEGENWRLPWQISVVQMAKGAGGSSPIAHGYIKSRSAGKKTALRKGNRLKGKQRRSASRERKSGLRNRNT